MKKKVEKVTEGVYVVVGYALGNSILIVTGEGKIICRCIESHFEQLEGAWEDRYIRSYGFWRPFVMDVIYYGTFQLI